MLHRILIFAAIALFSGLMGSMGMAIDSAGAITLAYLFFLALFVSTVTLALLGVGASDEP